MGLIDGEPDGRADAEPAGPKKSPKAGRPPLGGVLNVSRRRLRVKQARGERLCPRRAPQEILPLRRLGATAALSRLKGKILRRAARLGSTPACRRSPALRAGARRRGGAEGEGSSVAKPRRQGRRRSLAAWAPPAVCCAIHNAGPCERSVGRPGVAAIPWGSRCRAAPQPDLLPHGNHADS